MSWTDMSWQNDPNHETFCPSTHLSWGNKRGLGSQIHVENGMKTGEMSLTYLLLQYVWIWLCIRCSYHIIINNNCGNDQLQSLAWNVPQEVGRGNTNTLVLYSAETKSCTFPWLGLFDQLWKNFCVVAWKTLECVRPPSLAQKVPVLTAGCCQTPTKSITASRLHYCNACLTSMKTHRSRAELKNYWTQSQSSQMNRLHLRYVMSQHFVCLPACWLWSYTIMDKPP